MPHQVPVASGRQALFAADRPGFFSRGRETSDAELAGSFQNVIFIFQLPREFRGERIVLLIATMVGHDDVLFSMKHVGETAVTPRNTRGGRDNHLFAGGKSRLVARGGEHLRFVNLSNEFFDELIVGSFVQPIAAIHRLLLRLSRPTEGMSSHLIQ